MTAMVGECVLMQGVSVGEVFMDAVVSTSVAQMIARAMDIASRAGASAKLVTMVMLANASLMRVQS
jgi:hypothetical protein